jgi:Tfp pilus assembly protein PilV
MNQVLRAKGSEGGFGLLSTLIAMVLLSIAVTALSSAGLSVLAVHTDSAVRSTATLIAASYLEEVKARGVTTVVAESGVQVNDAGVNDAAGHFQRSLEVATDEELQYAKRVTVKVAYPKGRRGTGVIELVTILYEGDE